mgnify:CR=1 FL=1
MENQQILMEMFKARDSGDEKESKLEALLFIKFQFVLITV